MPLVPTLPAPATPNLAEAYGQGARTRVGLLGIKQQAAEAAQRLSLGYAQIAAQQQEAQMRHQAAQMELQGKQALAQQEMLRQQQEMEMTNAYRQAQLGLETQNLARMQSETAMKLKEAADQQRVMTETRTALDQAETYAVPEYRNSLISEIERRSAILSGRNPPSYGSSVPRADSTTGEIFRDPETGERAGMVVTPEGATSGRYIPDRTATGPDPSITIRRMRLMERGRVIRKELEEIRDGIKMREQYRHGTYDPNEKGIHLGEQNTLKELELRKRRLLKEESTNEDELDQLEVDAAGGAPRRLQAPTDVPGGAPGTNAPPPAGTNAPASKYRLVK